jgi:hypothetical protein
MLMNTKFTQDAAPLTDLKANPGRIVKQVTEVHRPALRDLKEIRAWYAEQGVPEMGDRLVAEVFQKAEHLVDHPDTHYIKREFNCVAHTARYLGEGARDSGSSPRAQRGRSGGFGVRRLWGKRDSPVR